MWLKEKPESTTKAQGDLEKLLAGFSKRYPYWAKNGANLLKFNVCNCTYYL